MFTTHKKTAKEGNSNSNNLFHKSMKSHWSSEPNSFALSKADSDQPTFAAQTTVREDPGATFVSAFQIFRAISFPTNKKVCIGI
jgi:hypothetical protein